MRYGFSTGLSAVSDSRAIYYMDFPLLMSTIFSIVLTDWMSRAALLRLNGWPTTSSSRPAAPPWTHPLA